MLMNGRKESNYMKGSQKRYVIITKGGNNHADNLCLELERQYGDYCTLTTIEHAIILISVKDTSMGWLYVTVDIWLCYYREREIVLDLYNNYCVHVHYGPFNNYLIYSTHSLCELTMLDCFHHQKLLQK